MEAKPVHSHHPPCLLDPSPDDTAFHRLSGKGAGVVGEKEAH